MKKTITLLLLAISFVMMTLISWMKFQANGYIQSSQAPVDYQMEDSDPVHSNQMMGLRPFEP